MKKFIALTLALLLSLVLFAACGSAKPEEKTVEECVQQVSAMFQPALKDNTPIGEACKALGVTKPEEGMQSSVLQPDSANILGHLFRTHLGYSIPNPTGKPVEEMPTTFVEYMTYWNGTPEEAELVLQMRDALTELCGAPYEDSGDDGSLSLATADAEALSALQPGESVGSDWAYQGTCSVSLSVYIAADGLLEEGNSKGALLFTIEDPFLYDANGNLLWDGEAAATPAPTDRIPEEIRNP